MFKLHDLNIVVSNKNLQFSELTDKLTAMVEEINYEKNQHGN